MGPWYRITAIIGNRCRKCPVLTLYLITLGSIAEDACTIHHKNDGIPDLKPETVVTTEKFGLWR